MVFSFSLNLHDWEIFDAWNMLQSKLHPDDNVVVGDIIVSRGPFPNTSRCFVLVRILATREELFFSEFGHVDGMVGKAEGVSQV